MALIPITGQQIRVNTKLYNETLVVSLHMSKRRTLHILYGNDWALPGMMGGDNSLASGTTGGGTPTIIFQGRCYQVIAKVSASGPAASKLLAMLRPPYWREIYWERPVYVNETIPTAILSIAKVLPKYQVLKLLLIQ